MKKKYGITVVLMSALIGILCFSGSSFAMGTGTIGSNESSGQALIFGYYDTRTVAQGGPGLTDNYFTVTNTSDQYIQAHVRVRTGERSLELLDFDVVLTPWDVFGWDLYQIDNHMVFVSCDTHTLIQSGFDLNYNRDNNAATGDSRGNDCVIYTTDPSKLPYYQPNLISIIKACTSATDEQAVAQTLKGYAEVIVEGAFRLSRSDGDPRTNNCEIVEPGMTLYDWVYGNRLNFPNFEGNCDVSYNNSVIGKIYYAEVAPGLAQVLRLADLNAFAIWNLTEDVILHKNTYLAELQSPTGPGYAYDFASDDPEGAKDLNLCLFTDDIDASTAGKQWPDNPLGAAASFGPTLADYGMYYGRMWSGDPVDWRRTVVQIDALSADPFYEAYNATTSSVATHFFNLPPVAKSSFVFTFPTMHFMDQRIQVRETLAFDTEENDCVIPPGKFISPGLPGAPQFAQEVNIFTPTTCPTFAEGWRKFSLNVARDGVGNQLNFYDYFGDGVNDSRNVSPTGYSPLAISFVMTTGADAFSTSPLARETGNPVTWTDNDPNPEP